jgi:hypothetical protein
MPYSNRATLSLSAPALHNRSTIVPGASPRCVPWGPSAKNLGAHAVAWPHAQVRTHSSLPLVRPSPPSSRCVARTPLCSAPSCVHGARLSPRWCARGLESWARPSSPQQPSRPATYVPARMTSYLYSPFPSPLRPGGRWSTKPVRCACPQGLSSPAPPLLRVRLADRAWPASPAVTAPFPSILVRLAAMAPGTVVRWPGGPARWRSSEPRPG